jgi:hypothetical protein
MSKTTKPQELLTLQGLAIRLGISYPKAIELHRAGKLGAADFTLKHFQLFSQERVASLKDQISL